MTHKFTLIAVAAFSVWLAVAWAGSSRDDTPSAAEADSVPPCCPVGKSQCNEQPPAPQVDAQVESVALPASATPARASGWIEPADRDPFDLDFKMTNQDGQSLVLSELAGSPMAMSFIFTRCSNPKMCPMITLAMAHLQRDLDAVGLGQKVKLLLVTYDPVYDNPERLKKYGVDRGLAFTNTIMLRPDVDQFRQLLSEFQIGADYRSDGSIGHVIELLLIDHKGRFVRDYQGQVWDNALVLEDLKKLVAEQALELAGDS